MSKMSELSQVLDEMVSCGENLIQAAKALKDIFSSTEEEISIFGRCQSRFGRKIEKRFYRRSQRNYFKTWGLHTLRH